LSSGGAYDDIHHAGQSANVEHEHDLRVFQGDWDDCPCSSHEKDVVPSSCPCKVSQSYVASLMRMIKLHRYTVLALLHEISILTKAFMKDPESVHAKLKKHKK
jgi:hypothetical protein